jgi:hypothetical protein
MLVLMVDSAATANGRFPAARFLTIEPPTIALATTFGLASSADGGRSWHFSCEEALGFDSTLRWDSALAISGNTLAVGLPDGLSTGSAAGCAAFTRPLTAPIETVIDLAADGPRLAAAVAPAGAPNGVALSEDGGLTWRLAWSRPNFSIATVDLAPNHPQRLYASGALDGAAAVLRSDDGGATFAPTGATFPDSVFLYLAGVDPQNADRVFARSDLRTGGTALLRSDDGGTTFRELRRTTNPMTGFAFAPGAAALWTGSPGINPGDGVFRSTDGGVTWNQVSIGLTTQCLRYRDGILYMCADGFRDPFALGCSTDQGLTWHALMTWEDLRGPDACPAGPSRERCQASWPALRAQLLRDGGAARDPGACLLPLPDAGADAPVITPDAAPAADADLSHVGGGGCACRITGGAPTPGPLVLLVIWATCRRARAAHSLLREGARWPRRRSGG